MSLQACPVITLLTDFGDRDSFVASMKGVILGINPEARIVDVSHQVTPHAVDEAAYLLKSAYQYFPEGSVHVAVVDPGVGSDRRPLLVKSARYFFLAPDNGLLASVIDAESGVEIRHIENRQYQLDRQGVTFDGRDLFAPCAAWLTRGQPLSSYGPLTHEYVRRAEVPPRIQQGVLQGRVAHVDRFGNIISNITVQDLSDWRAVTNRTDADMRLSIGGCRITGLVRCYAEGDREHPHALINSNGQVEVFLREGRASQLLEVEIGTAVEIRASE